MESNLRRRVHPDDVDGGRRDQYDASGFDGFDEPLLGCNRDLVVRKKGLTLEDIWDAERSKEKLHLTLLFSQLIAQWAQCLANMVLGSGSLVGRFLPLLFVSQNGSGRKLLQVQPSLTPLQEARLKNLQQRLGVPFNGSCVEHQDALRKLWKLAYPDRELPSLKSEMWKDMGWQGSDPSTDFRGGGFISLENLIFFAQKYPDSFQKLLHKKEGIRAEWEYPFSVAGINISFMLVQMLDIQSGKPSTPSGIRFLEILADDGMAFDNLFCVAFQMMDAQWLAKRASYMQFNEVLNSTRSQLERELAIDDVYSVVDLPAYNMLKG